MNIWFVGRCLSWPRVAHNSSLVPLLVNGHIIFFPLHFADGFTTEIFY